MITLYFHDIDSAGHNFGPNAAETREAVLKVDAAIKRLVDGLRTRKIFGKANLILFADHGMAETDWRDVTLVDDHIDLDDTERILWTYEFLQIFPKEGKRESLIGQLRKMPYAKCWNKEDIPARFNYAHGPRVAPIICSSDEGRIFSSNSRYAEILKKGGIDRERGGHGYDNDLISMRAMFVAHGSAFKRFYVAEPFPNVDVYELMCKILKITPAKNDGNFERVKKMLR
jgi:predicted AlkP superfamily pyrophosphatase or phosphodiesterase